MQQQPQPAGKPPAAPPGDQQLQRGAISVLTFDGARDDGPPPLPSAPTRSSSEATSTVEALPVAVGVPVMAASSVAQGTDISGYEAEVRILGGECPDLVAGIAINE